MEYTKRDSIMVKGLAALCMVCLHLFCRQGTAVFGKPLIWINDTTPLVFLFGFFSEICVPLYSMSAGYAQQLMLENGKLSLKSNAKRIFRLLKIYWIILVLFSILGLIFDKSGGIPGNIADFLKSIVLLHSYNGAWWYLNTYIILLLIPYRFLFGIINKLSTKWEFAFCFCVEAAWYVVSRFNILPNIPDNMVILGFIGKELSNLIFVLPYVWAGAILCKWKVVERTRAWYKEHIQDKYYNLVVLLALTVLFIAINLIHKFVLTGTSAVITFILFNLLKKPKPVESCFLVLGKHSTVIWLTHMFFYMYLFKGLVFIARYPLLILLFMLFLCIITSYIVRAIEWCINNLYTLIIAKKGKCKESENAVC